MKNKRTSSELALWLAKRGLQFASLAMFIAYIFLLYTETAIFQAEFALRHAACEFCSVGSSVLLLALLSALIVQDRLGE